MLEVPFSINGQGGEAATEESTVQDSWSPEKVSQAP